MDILTLLEQLANATHHHMNKLINTQSPEIQEIFRHDTSDELKKRLSDKKDFSNFCMTALPVK